MCFDTLLEFWKNSSLPLHFEERFLRWIDGEALNNVQGRLKTASFIEYLCRYIVQKQINRFPFDRLFEEIGFRKGIQHDFLYCNSLNSDELFTLRNIVDELEPTSDRRSAFFDYAKLTVLRIWWIDNLECLDFLDVT